MINWRAYPFARLVVPLILGIVVASSSFSIPLFAVLILGAASSVIAIVTAFATMPKINWGFGVALTLFLFCIGFVRSNQHNELSKNDHFRTAVKASNQVIGWVSSLPEQNNWVKVRLAVEQMADETNQWNNYTGNLLLYLEKDSLSQDLNYGDMLLLDTRILEVPSAKNPNTFDYKAYLHYQNIHYQCFVRSHQWQYLSGNHGNWVWSNIYAFRMQLLKVLDKHLLSEDAFAIGAALTLGYRAALSEEVETAYANAGAIHILAVSGLHVGIIYLIINFLLRGLPFSNRWVNVTLSLAGIWLFALLTGASPSVLRAATMFSFIAIGKHIERQNNIYNSLAAAAFFTLLWNPYMLMQVGFQLSYLAVLSIVFFQPKLYSLIYFNYKVPDYLWKITTVSIAAQIGVFPISMYYFHQFPTYFWLSSLVVIPAAVVILSGGILIFMTTLVPLINDVFGAMLNFAIEVVNTIVFAVQGLPMGIIDGIYIAPHEVLLLYGAIVSAVLIILKERFKYTLLLLTFVASFLVSRAVKKTQQYFRQEIVIYDLNKETVIDFMDGYQCFSLMSSDTLSKNFGFSVMPHRLASGIQNTQHFEFTQATSQKRANWYVDFPFVQFYDKRFAFVNHSNWQIAEQPIAVDYLVISETPKISIVQLTRIFDFQLLIFDTSNDWKQVQSWKEQCLQEGLNFYDVRTAGAWRLIF